MRIIMRTAAGDSKMEVTADHGCPAFWSVFESYGNEFSGTLSYTMAEAVWQRRGFCWIKCAL